MDIHRAIKTAKISIGDRILSPRRLPISMCLRARRFFAFVARMILYRSTDT